MNYCHTEKKNTSFFFRVIDQRLMRFVQYNINKKRFETCLEEMQIYEKEKKNRVRERRKERPSATLSINCMNCISEYIHGGGMYYTLYILHGKVKCSGRLRLVPLYGLFFSYCQVDCYNILHIFPSSLSIIVFFVSSDFASYLRATSQLSLSLSLTSFLLPSLSLFVLSPYFSSPSLHFSSLSSGIIGN